MTPEILRYRIAAERQADFLAAYTVAGESLRASPHCLGYELLQSAKDAELYLLTIHWDSPEGHLQGFRRSAEFARFLEQVKPYIGDLLEMEHYAATDLHWRRA